MNDLVTIRAECGIRNSRACTKLTIDSISGWFTHDAIEYFNYRRLDSVLMPGETIDAVFRRHLGILTVELDRIGFVLVELLPMTHRSARIRFRR
jgi:hypothetical protein